MKSNVEVVNLEVPDKTFEPLGRLVIFKLLEQERSRGGVVLPERTKARDRPTEEAPVGLVIAAGAKCQWVKRGDRVLLMGQFFNFKHNGIKLWMVDEEQVLGVERSAEGGFPAYYISDWVKGVVMRSEVRKSDPLLERLRGAKETREYNQPDDRLPGPSVSDDH